MPGTGAAGASYGDLLVTSLVVLGGVCVAAFLVVRLVGRLLATGRARGAHVLDVVARLPLEPRRSLYIVEVAGKALLVGTSEMGLSLLSELDPDEVRARGVERPSFGDLVRAAWLRRRGPGAARPGPDEQDQVARPRPDEQDQVARPRPDGQDAVAQARPRPDRRDPVVQARPKPDGQGAVAQARPRLDGQDPAGQARPRLDEQDPVAQVRPRLDEQDPVARSRLEGPAQLPQDTQPPSGLPAGDALPGTSPRAGEAS